LRQGQIIHPQIRAALQHLLNQFIFLFCIEGQRTFAIDCRQAAKLGMTGMRQPDAHLLRGEEVVQYPQRALENLVQVQAGGKLGDDAHQCLGALGCFSQLQGSQSHAFFQVLGQAARLGQQVDIFDGEGSLLR